MLIKYINFSTTGWHSSFVCWRAPWLMFVYNNLLYLHFVLIDDIWKLKNKIDVIFAPNWKNCIKRGSNVSYYIIVYLIKISSNFDEISEKWSISNGFWLKVKCLGKILDTMQKKTNKKKWEDEYVWSERHFIQKQYHLEVSYFFWI